MREATHLGEPLELLLALSVQKRHGDVAARGAGEQQRRHVQHLEEARFGDDGDMAMLTQGVCCGLRAFPEEFVQNCFARRAMLKEFSPVRYPSSEIKIFVSLCKRSQL